MESNDQQDRYSRQDVYITSLKQDRLQGLQVPNPHVYVIEKAQPPVEFEEPYHKLPPTVDFQRIVTNVKNSLGSLKRRVENNRSSDNQNINEKFKRYMLKQQNLAIVSDSFWYAICKLIKVGQYKHSQEQLLKRMAKNYMSFMLEISPDLDSTKNKENDLFFQHYYDILSQSIFYSFFYAFPKSRAQFNQPLKNKLLSIFSKLFTGIEMSESKLQWNIDLGTSGNILAKQKQQEQAPTTKLPRLGKTTRSRRHPMQIRYSPIMQLYLQTYNYKTRNYVRQYRMKLTQPDQDSEKKQLIFKQYSQQAKKIAIQVNAIKRNTQLSKQNLDNYIKKLKQETINHHRRLEKRKAEELERGAHEYANYLVSMMNAGVTMTNLGVVRQN